MPLKNKVMRNLKAKNMYDALSRVSMFLGTMITTATAGVVMGSLLHGGGIAAIGAALTAPVVGALAVGVGVIAIAIAADYMGSYIGQSANFDVQEVSAKSTARGIRNELEEMVTSKNAILQPKAAKNWAAQAEAEKLLQSLEISARR